jgi:hypothetical protein
MAMDMATLHIMDMDTLIIIRQFTITTTVTRTRTGGRLMETMIRLFMMKNHMSLFPYSLIILHP